MRSPSAWRGKRGFKSTSRVTDSRSLSRESAEGPCAEGTMKRRDFLFGGGAAAATVSAQAQAASAAKAMPPPKLDPDALEKKLERIDHRMAELNGIDIAPREPESEEEAELFASRARVSRTALRSLYFVGAFMDLEEHDR